MDAGAAHTRPEAGTPSGSGHSSVLVPDPIYPHWRSASSGRQGRQCSNPALLPRRNPCWVSRKTCFWSRCFRKPSIPLTRGQNLKPFQSPSDGSKPSTDSGSGQLTTPCSYNRSCGCGCLPPCGFNSSNANSCPLRNCPDSPPGVRTSISSALRNLGRCGPCTAPGVLPKVWSSSGSASATAG